MTAHTPRILTEAETSLLQAFEAADWLPGDAAVRSAAAGSLRENGLPTRRVEAFHYTDMRANLEAGYSPCKRPNFDTATSAMVDYERLLPVVRLPIINGHYFADLAGELPQGVSVEPGFRTHKASQKPEDVVETINTAFVTDGVNINVAAMEQVGGKLAIANSYLSGEGGLQTTRNSVSLEEGSFLSVVDRFRGDDGLKYLTNTVVDIELAEDSTLNYVLAIEEGDAAQRLARMNVLIGKNATLNLFILASGGKFVRQEIVFDVVGEGANLNISGVNLIGGEAHIDITSSITHHVPNTNANEIFRNVATGRGRGVFQGQINVRQPAQLTDARMACNTLLLSDDCDFSAKPELEIFADDVQCAHGATVTDLEDSYMFYLMARGISETTARRMLIKAFVAEIVEELEDEDLIEALEARIDVWMEQHV